MNVAPTRHLVAVVLAAGCRGNDPMATGPHVRDSACYPPYITNVVLDLDTHYDDPSNVVPVTDGAEVWDADPPVDDWWDLYFDAVGMAPVVEVNLDLGDNLDPGRWLRSTWFGDVPGEQDDWCRVSRLGGFHLAGGGNPIPIGEAVTFHLTVVRSADRLEDTWDATVHIVEPP